MRSRDGRPSPRTELRLWVLWTIVVGVILSAVGVAALTASAGPARTLSPLDTASGGGPGPLVALPSPVTSPAPAALPAAAATSPPDWETGNLIATIPDSVAPFAVAFDSGNGNVYVADALSDNVSVISGATDAVLATIPVGEVPQGVAYDSANGEVYVANTDSSNVTVIDGATDQVVPTGPAGIGVGEDPIGVAFDPTDGDIYVANELSANVSVISGATNTVVATVLTPASGEPFGVAYDSTNNEVYVTDSSAAEVSVVDPATNAVVGSPVAVGTTPTGVLADPATGYVYVANFDSSTVSIIDGATNSVVGADSTGTDSFCEFLAYDSGNGNVYVTGVLSDAITVISGVSQDVVATLGPESSLETARGIAFDDTNGELFATAQDSEDVAVYSTLLLVGDATPYLRGLGEAGSGLPPISLAANAGPFGAAYDSADGDVYVADAGNAGLGPLPSANVSVVSGTTDTVVATVAVGSGPVAVAYDSGNGNIYVAEAGSGQHNVSVIDTATNTIIDTIDVGFTPQSIVYDSDTGNLYVPCFGSDATYVISGATNTVLTELTGEDVPGQAAYDPANGDIYIATEGTDTLTVVDGATDTVVASIPTGSVPYALAYDSATGDLFVTNFGSANVSVVSGSLNQVVGTVPVGPSPEGVAYDSANFDVYVSSATADNVTVINGGTEATVTSLPAGSTPVGLVYDPGNGQLYVANAGSHNLSAFNTLSARNVPTNGFLDVGQSLLLEAPLVGPGTGALTLMFDSSNTTGLPCSADPIGSASLSGACVGEAPGTYSVTFSLTDSEGNSVETSFPVSVYSDPTATIPTASPGTIDLGQATVFATSASGGRGGFTYAWSGLPTGCVSADAPSLVCTPTVAGSASVSVRVTDNNGFVLTEGPAALVVSDDPSVGTPTASPGAVDVGQSTTLAATLSNPGSGADSYVWNGLPGGCTSTNGLTLTCMPTAVGTFSIDVSVQDLNLVTELSSAVALVVSPALGPAQVVASASTVSVGGIVVFSASVTGGSGGYSYAWSGLPAGCASSNSGTLACSPTSTTGSPVTVSVKVTDSNGASVTATAASVTVSAAASPTSSSSSSPSTFDWVALVLAVVAIALAAVALLRGGRKGGSPPRATLPPPAAVGTTTGPPPPWSEQPPPSQ